MVFKTLTEEKRETDTEAAKTREYEQYDLNQDMGEGDTFQGQPYLTGVYENDYGASANLYISNHENQERLRCRVKTKSTEDKVSFWENSLGYDMIKSIEKQEGNNITDNVLTISFTELQDYINNLEEITIKVITHTSEIRGEVVNWNTIKITNIEG